jgi:hypothetical protein
MPKPEPDGGTAASGVALLRGTLQFAGSAGVLLVAGCSVRGAPAAAGAAVGSVLALAALSVGPAIMRTGAQASPPAVMARALGGYLGLVLLLGGAYLALGSAGWLSPGFVGLGLVVATVAGIAGQLRAVTRLRVLAFGSGGALADPPGDRKAAGQPQKSGGLRTRRD